MSYSLGGGIAGAIVAWILSPKIVDDDSERTWSSSIKSFLTYAGFVSGGAIVGMKIGLEKIANGTYPLSSSVYTSATN